MRGLSPTLAVLGRIAGGVLLFTILVAVPTAAGAAAGIVGVLMLFLFNGWALYAFLHHRHGQQDELLAVLTATAEAGLPLASGVAAYRADRTPRPFARTLR